MNFTQLTEYLDTLASVGVPGCDLVIYRDHEPIYRHMAGHRDAANREPMRGDETYILFSCTKVFTTCAAMQLIERGALGLDDPVYRYLPAFEDLKVRDGDSVRPARTVMTVRHLMSMQSGLDYDMMTPTPKRVLEETNGQATTRQLIEARVNDPLSFDPGTDFLYSLSHDALGAVIEAASGMRFSDYLRANIFEPLGLDTIGFVLKPEDRARLCAEYEYSDEVKAIVLCPEPVNNYRYTPNYESGGAGLASDVKDYIAFADALACGGVAKNGAKILSPQMMQLWSANQLGPKSRASFDGWKRMGYSYGLGVRTRVDLSVGGRGQIGEFGWDGAAGAWAMIDPINHISAFFAEHVRNYGYNYDVVHPTIRDLIYGGIS